MACTVDAAGQARAKGEGLLSGHVGKPTHFIVTGTRSPPAVQVFAHEKVVFDIDARRMCGIFLFNYTCRRWMDRIVFLKLVSKQALIQVRGMCLTYRLKLECLT